MQMLQIFFEKKFICTLLTLKFIDIERVKRRNGSAMVYYMV